MPLNDLRTPSPPCANTGQVLVQGAKAQKHRVAMFALMRQGGRGYIVEIGEIWVATKAGCKKNTSSIA